MKKIVFSIIYIWAFVLVAQAQQPRFIFDKDSTNTDISSPETKTKIDTPSKEPINLDSLNKVPPAIPAWNITRRLGERIQIVMDTALYDFHQESLIDGQGIAMGYLGNWGSPTQSKLFFENAETSLFQFLEPYKPYYKTPSNQRFLSTKEPYSNIYYQSGGSRQSKEERFTGEISISFNKNLTIGFDIDYVYSRGYYQYNSAKQINYDFFVAYISDKYQMHALVANNNFTNSENGGVNFNAPNSAPLGKEDAQDYPTYLSETWNYLRGKHLYLTNKYNLGYEKEGTKTFIPVASVILTNDYTDQRRRFHSKNIQALDEYYDYKKGSNLAVDEEMAYYSFKNTLGISLNEGFRDWVKFGLTAYIQQDNRLYRMPTQNLLWASSDKKESSTSIGGILSKEKGDALKYNLSGELGVLGYDQGSFKVEADIISAFNIKGQKATIKANGYIKSLVPQYFQQNLVSKYYEFTDNNFKNTKRMYAGAEINIPHTQTSLSGGIENITNYIYYNKARGSSLATINQDEGSTQVVMLRLNQKLHYGILHWDNQIAYQQSSNEGVIPVPKLSLYTNLYIKTSLAKVLTIQLGVDAHFYTKYYGQSYDPALGQFTNQNDTEIGNFPFSTAYVNLHLKKTRIFLMMYNVAQNYGNSNYMTVPNYPVNPMIFKFGLSWNFTN